MSKEKYLELIPFVATSLIYELHESGYSAYLVGGCVRDMVLGVEPHDWDICTSAKPEEIIRVIKKAGYGYHTVGIEFGTVTAIVAGIEYEITTYRAETDYTDGRHPDTVNYVADIHEDLKRRDFTINAMAYDPINYELIDDFGGKNDLENRIIRAVGKPAERFEEDSLRILRALRFAIKYQFKIDDETSLCMHRQRGLLANISKERITAELEKMLTCGKPIKEYFLEYKDIIGTIIPELVKCFYFNQHNRYHIHDVYEHLLAVTDFCGNASFEVKLAALLHDVAKPNCFETDANGDGHFYGHPEVSADLFREIAKNNLILTNEQLENVYLLIKYHDNLVASTRASVKRMLNKIGEDRLRDWFIIKQADLDDHKYPDGKPDWYMDISKLKEIMNEILEEQSCFSLKDLDINGNILMEELGIKPGKHIGKILNSLLEEVIDEKLVNETNALINRAAEIYKNINL